MPTSEQRTHGRGSSSAAQGGGRAVGVKAAEHADEFLTHVDPAAFPGLRRVQGPAGVASLHVERPLDEVDVVPLKAEGLARTQAGPREREEEGVEPAVLGALGRLQERRELLARHRTDLLEAGAPHSGLAAAILRARAIGGRRWPAGHPGRTARRAKGGPGSRKWRRCP